jgi:hypothetical protein
MLDVSHDLSMDCANHLRRRARVSKKSVSFMETP